MQETPSALKREHPALKNMESHPFFPIFVGTFALLNSVPDPAD
jgi:hypothetical protein